MGRPGRTEPDFIFYPRNTTPIQFYGVIELKRPDQKIVTQTRKNVAILSRDAQTAVEQTLQYALKVPDLIRTPIAGGQLFLGNHQYLFVIMGLVEHEFALHPNNERFREIIQNRLPGNLTILPYDTLLKNFEVVMYITPKLLPFPDFISTAFFIYQGPLLVVTFIGLYPFLSKENVSVPVILGTIFGAIAGVCRMMFSVVQLTNLVYIRKYIGAADTPEAKQIWQDIFSGMFTVQNG